MSQDDLRDLLRDITPEPPGATAITVDQVARRVRRARARRFGAGVGVAALVVGGVVLWPQGSGPDRARDRDAGRQTMSNLDAAGGPSPTGPDTGAGDSAAARNPWVGAAGTVSRCQALRDPWAEPAPVSFEGERYRITDDGEAWALADLGPALGEALCPGVPDSGDGSADDAGTNRAGVLHVYAVAGFNPSCRVGVRRDTSDGLVGDVVVLEAVRPPTGVDCDRQDPMPGTGGFRGRVFSHCGVHSITVDGQLWLADPPLVENGNPPAGWGANVAPGLFVVDASGERAEFRTDSGRSAEFRIAEPGERSPALGCD